MKIITYFILLGFLNFNASSAELKSYWTGIAGLYFTDGSHGIMFDPAFNRPRIWQLLFNGEFHVNEQITRNVLTKIQASKVDAIFISHTHADHYADAPIVSKIKGSMIIGSKTAQFLSLSSGVDISKTQIIKDGSIVKIGNFTIEVLKSSHGLIMGFFEYQGGELNQTPSFPIKMWNYRMGGSYTYVVRHKAKTILVQQASRINNELKAKLSKLNIDVVFQGIANRRSTKDIDINIWKPSNAKTIVPMHHDNFFFQLSNDQKISYLPGVNITKFKNYFTKSQYKLVLPIYYQNLKL